MPSRIEALSTITNSRAHKDTAESRMVQVVNTKTVGCVAAQHNDVVLCSISWSRRRTNVDLDSVPTSSNT